VPDRNNFGPGANGVPNGPPSFVNSGKAGDAIVAFALPGNEGDD